MIIDGKALAKDLNLRTQSRIEKLSFRPLLVDIVVGSDPASLSYARIKERAAIKYGLSFESIHLADNSTDQDVIGSIEQLSQREELRGLIIQIPLPSHLNQDKILNSIPAYVDVDLLNQQSVENFYKGNSQLIPPTPAAILHILDSLSEDLSNKKFLVLGRGELVGRPIAYLLKARGYNVTVAHSKTSNTDELLLESDCIISGVGKSKLITGDKIKDGVIIIDAGTSEANGSIVGDVDFDSCQSKARYITPVPGGVGPLTVAKLLENVVVLAESIQKNG